MNIYLITFIEVGYDEYFGFVVQANTIEKAKELCGVDSASFCSNRKTSNIKEASLIGTNNENEEKIILESFRAG